jgi:hypothetical protein
MHCRTYLVADVAAVALKPDGGPEIDLQANKYVKRR